MRKTNRKTSLKLTFQPEGGASIEMKWSDADSIRPHEDVAREIIGELCKLPDFEFLLETGPGQAYKYELWSIEVIKSLLQETDPRLSDDTRLKEITLVIRKDSEYQEYFKSNKDPADAAYQGYMNRFR
jgi:hypothetical protein